MTAIWAYKLTKRLVRHYVFKPFYIMKKILLFTAALAALTLVSCKKEQGRQEQEAPLIPARITVNILGTGTKATGMTKDDATKDAKVNDLQVFVFRGDELEDYKAVGAAMQATLAATSGQRTVFALVNAPSAASVRTLTELRALTTRLSDNATNSFVMSGFATQDVVDGATVPVVVKRNVARVSINKISTDFKLLRENWRVHVKGLYLINVAGENNIALSAATPGSYVNKLAHSDSAYDALLYDPMNIDVYNSHPYIGEHAFFPYPNPVTNSDCLSAAGLAATDPLPGVWSPRATILVIDVTLSGELAGEPFTTNGYYPISLPVLERNKTYVIEEVQITREPSDVPYQPILTGNSSINITVGPWEVGLNLGTVII